MHHNSAYTVLVSITQHNCNKLVQHIIPLKKPVLCNAVLVISTRRNQDQHTTRQRVLAAPHYGAAGTIPTHKVIKSGTMSKINLYDTTIIGMLTDYLLGPPSPQLTNNP